MPSTVSSFRFPSFRLLWTNNFLCSLSLNSFDILMTWLVLETTDSVIFLSLVTGLRWAPSAFGMIAGLVADRFDRRKLLIILNMGSIAISLSMGLIIMGRLIPPWYILVATFIIHAFTTFGGPARQVYEMDIVGKGNLTNAVALNNIAMRIASVVGSSLIGTFFYWLGMGPFFFLVSAIYLIGLFALTTIKQSAETRAAEANKGKSIVKDLADGLRYVGGNRILLGLQMIALSHNLFTGVCLFTLMPVFARDILHIDASGLGWINTVWGLGSLLGAVSIASLHLKLRRGWLILFAFVEGASWALFSASTTYYFAALCVALSSIGMLTYMTTIQTLLLTNSAPNIRGRVMGIRILVILPQSAFGLIWGAISQRIGVPTALAAAGSLHCLFVLIVLILVPHIKRLE